MSDSKAIQWFLEDATIIGPSIEPENGETAREIAYVNHEVDGSLIVKCVNGWDALEAERDQLQADRDMALNHIAKLYTACSPVYGVHLPHSLVKLLAERKQAKAGE